MLYVCYGDRFAAREKSRELVKICKKKRPNATYIYLSELSLTHNLESLLYGTGLFETKYIVLLDELLNYKEFAKHLLENLKEYQNSEHVFIIFEEEIKEVILKKFKKVDTVFYKEEIKQDVKNSNNIFNFVEVFLKRDKSKTLVQFHKLLKEGESSEMMLNLLLWQIRNLNLANQETTATDAGMKEFPFKKAKAALKNFSKDEPFKLLSLTERILRKGRLNGLQNEEIVECIILFS